MFTSILETNKFQNDFQISNKIYAFIGGIPINDLLKLELEFLSKINFNLINNGEKFLEYKKNIIHFYNDNLSKSLKSLKSQQSIIIPEITEISLRNF
jgi:hypothetical protein